MELVDICFCLPFPKQRAFPMPSRREEVQSTRLTGVWSWSVNLHYCFSFSVSFPILTPHPWYRLPNKPSTPKTLSQTLEKARQRHVSPSSILYGLKVTPCGMKFTPRSLTPSHFLVALTHPCTPHSIGETAGKKVKQTHTWVWLCMKLAMQSESKSF